MSLLNDFISYFFNSSSIKFLYFALYQFITSSNACIFICIYVLLKGNTQCEILKKNRLVFHIWIVYTFKLKLQNDISNSFLSQSHSENPRNPCRSREYFLAKQCSYLLYQPDQQFVVHDRQLYVIGVRYMWFRHMWLNRLSSSC